MNLYKISQEVNNDYDTYDSAIVAAKTKEEAKNISPSKYIDDQWCLPVYVNVEFIGRAKKCTYAGVILASFHAG